MVNFKQWSLNKIQIQILRYTAGYTDGVYARTLSETIDTYASAQPYKTIDADQTFRSEMGENVEKRLILFLNEEIFLDDEDNPTQTVNDIIVADGRQWKPVSVNNWNFQNLTHYRAVLRLFDGY